MRLRTTSTIAAAIAAAMLAGCSSGSSQGTAKASESAASSQGGAKAGGSLEVFSWWTSGAEVAALDAIYAAYGKDYPSVKIVNGAVAGGGGANAQAVLQSRLQGGKPPDTWQTHPGTIIQQYVQAGVVQPVTSLFKAEGWDSVIPKVILDNTSSGGQIYSVETGVHRGNLVWFNKHLLGSQGITVTPQTTMPEFLADIAKLKAAGVTPVCLGDGSGGFGNQMLMENALLGELGPDGWDGLFDGKTKWSDPKVEAALRDYATMYDNANADHSALTWDEAVKDLVAGKCAFDVMGDWSYGELKKDGAKEGVDFGYIPFPGAPTAYDMVIDSFVVAKHAKDQVNAMNWEKEIMSKDAQIAFSLQKGSIPVRTDVPMDQFPPYQRQAAKDFRSSSEHLVWSLANGEVGSPAFVQAYDNAITSFNANKNASGFVQAMTSAASSS